MKILNILAILLLSITVSANNDDLNRLLNERQQQIVNFQVMQDSVVPGNARKQSMLYNQLLLIKSLDDNLINSTQQLMGVESSIRDSLQTINSHLLTVSEDRDMLQQRTTNDMRMLLIMKVVIGILLLGILLLLYLYFSKTKSKQESVEMVPDSMDTPQLSQERDQMIKQIDELQKQLTEVKAKNASILNKINKLINDLSSVG
ncbi:MAG: hypothetical protein WCQ70_01125 [Lentimicrobiaceae bacterium]